MRSIIAISDAPSGSMNELSILYVDDNASANAEDKHAPVFQSCTATDLPLTLVSRFVPWDPLYLRGQPKSTLQPLPDLHVVLSTGSGIGLALDIWTRIVKPLFDHFELVEGQRYVLHRTTSETSVTDLIQDTILPKANEGMSQSILLLSGDGGIVDIINALLSGERGMSYEKPLIALLPLGTGNALANSTGITSDGTYGLRTALQGHAKELPLFRATFSAGARLLVNEGRDERQLHGVVDAMPVAHGAVVCSWGHHAALVADSDTAEYRKHGAERFKMAAKEALFPSDGSPPHAYSGKVSILRPGKTNWVVLPKDSHGYILATLVSHLEASFTISPASKPLDGKLRLVHFGNLSGKDAMDVMGKAYQGGKHVEDEKIVYEEITGLKIEFDEEDARWRRVCIDGSIIRVEKGGWVEVRNDVKAVVDLIVKD